MARHLFCYFKAVEENSNMQLSKRTISLMIIIICIAIPIIVYVSISVYIGVEVYNLVESSFQSKGQDYDSYTDLVGRINYKYLDYSDGHDEKWKKNYHTFPIVIHNFKTAQAYYIYTIDGNSIGGEKIPVTISLEKRSGKWYIEGVSEPY